MSGDLLPLQEALAFDLRVFGVPGYLSSKRRRPVADRQVRALDKVDRRRSLSPQPQHLGDPEAVDDLVAEEGALEPDRSLALDERDRSEIEMIELEDRVVPAVIFEPVRDVPLEDEVSHAVRDTLLEKLGEARQTGSPEVSVDQLVRHDAIAGKAQCCVAELHLAGLRSPPMRSSARQRSGHDDELMLVLRLDAQMGLYLGVILQEVRGKDFSLVPLRGIDPVGLGPQLKGRKVGATRKE